MKEENVNRHGAYGAIVNDSRQEIINNKEKALQKVKNKEYDDVVDSFFYDPFNAQYKALGRARTMVAVKEMSLPYQQLFFFFYFSLDDVASSIP